MWKMALPLVLVTLMGCYKGYKDASDLETDERGPGACAQACSDLGMRMSAFVLVENNTSGCVCSPAAGAAAGSDEAAAAVAGAHVVIERQRQAAQEQDEQRQRRQKRRMAQ